MGRSLSMLLALATAARADPQSAWSLSWGMGGGAIDVAGADGRSAAIDMHLRGGLTPGERWQAILDISAEAPFRRSLGCWTATARGEFFLLGDVRDDGLSVSAGAGFGALSSGAGFNQVDAGGWGPALAAGIAAQFRMGTNLAGPEFFVSRQNNATAVGVRFNIFLHR